MGRKNRIYPKDWLIYKPYTVPDQVDRYYVGLANEVMNLLENSEVSGFFSGHPELMRKAGVYFAMWFEDICSGVGIWRTVNEVCVKRYGVLLPFYDMSEYYEGEVNVQDTALLLWNFLQIYNEHDSVINPENPGLMETACSLAGLFDGEYETAPENVRLYEFVHNPLVSDDWWKCRELIEWFHMSSYVFIDSVDELADSAEEQIDMNCGSEHLSAQFYVLKLEQIFNYRYNLLSLTAAQWCGRIRRDPVFDTVHRSPVSYYLYKGEADAERIVLYDLVGDVEYAVERASFNRDSIPVILGGAKAGETVFITNLVRFKDRYYVAGVIFPEGKDKGVENVRMAREKKSLKEQQKDLYPVFLNASKGQPAVFVKDSAGLRSFYEKSMGFNLKDGVKMPDVPAWAACVAVYCDPVSGMYVSMRGGECVALPSNHFYDKEVAKDQALSFYYDGGMVTYWIACLLHDSNLLPDAALNSLKGYEYGRDFLHRNGSFFLDYFYGCCREYDYDPYQ